MSGIRYALKHGDRTTSGGMLMASGAGFMTHHGVLVGVEGDLATCPACKGHGRVQNDCRPNFDLMGRQLLVSGARVYCGCASPPFVIHSQWDFRVEVLAGGHAPDSSGGQDEQVAAAHRLTATSAAAAASQFDEKIRCVDEQGTPIPGVPYFIRDQFGNTHKGVTDEMGCCPRIKTDGPGTLDATFGIEALDLWAREGQ
ncbi:PAAR domain-containing protein [Cupriavidus agavae]|uniref:PAAR motif-containing protein n=1 Tax=Cupriavidus agavae TaxID=1001822 RepID=A0A4Q7RZX4_9BURK|nr:PAAR domain-containing protein [Cupriavidus agavae]RZT39424.1 PAAR motif-containing protein [Cupriavidus agavae]